MEAVLALLGLGEGAATGLGSVLAFLGLFLGSSWLVETVMEVTGGGVVVDRAMVEVEDGEMMGVEVAGREVAGRDLLLFELLRGASSRPRSKDASAPRLSCFSTCNRRSSEQ